MWRRPLSRGSSRNYVNVCSGASSNRKAADLCVESGCAFLYALVKLLCREGCLVRTGDRIGPKDEL